MTNDFITGLSVPDAGDLGLLRDFNEHGLRLLANAASLVDVDADAFEDAVVGIGQKFERLRDVVLVDAPGNTVVPQQQVDLLLDRLLQNQRPHFSNLGKLIKVMKS